MFVILDDTLRQPSLDELDPPAWGEPSYSSYLVTTCHRLRLLPIATFSTSDLRIMIGQGIGLRWLIPLALEFLAKEPLLEADFYPGDLLVHVLGVEGAYWSKNALEREQLNRLLAQIDEHLWRF